MSTGRVTSEARMKSIPEWECAQISILGESTDSYSWRGAIAWRIIDSWVSNGAWMSAVGGKINDAWVESVTKEDSARISEVTRDADADVWG